MKRLALTLALAGLVLAAGDRPSGAAIRSCDPQYSSLCVALTDHWSLGEVGDSTRYGSFGNTPLFEQDGVDITQGTVGSKTAAFFNSGGYLYLPRAGALPGYATIAFWYYPVDAAENQAIFSTQSCSSVTGTTTVHMRFTQPHSSNCGWDNCGLYADTQVFDINGGSIDKANSSPGTVEFSSPYFDDYNDIPVNAEIVSIHAMAYSKKDNSGTTANITQGVKLGSTTVWGAANTNGTTFAWKDSGALARPGGGSWTYGDLANLHYLIANGNEGNGNTVRVDQLYVDVEYANCQGWDTGVTIYHNDSNNHIRVSGAIQETDTVWVADGPAVTQGAWNFVVVTFSPFGTYGKNQVCVGVGDTSGNLSDPSTHCTNTGYFVRSNPSADWLIGGLANGVNKNRGYLREFLISGRAWSLSDVQEYYNNGAGLAVPFY
jgi:hypothetical protein